MFPFLLNQDKSVGEQIAAIDDALKKYFKLQVTTEGGKYYTPEYSKDNKVDVDKVQSKLEGILSDSQNLTRAFGSKDSSFKPVRFDFGASDTVSLETIATFNRERGDTIFSKDTHQVFVDEYVNTGSFNEALIDAAELVGMTPLKFLNTQSTNHGIGQVYRPQTTLNTDKPNYVASTEYLLNKGITMKAAKIFTGNFDAGTWTNMPNNHSFLNVDTNFKVSDLDTVLDFLKTDPKKYSVITNPFATDRQLLEVASTIFN